MKIRNWLVFVGACLLSASAFAQTPAQETQLKELRAFVAASYAAEDDDEKSMLEALDVVLERFIYDSGSLTESELEMVRPIWDDFNKKKAEEKSGTVIKTRGGLKSLGKRLKQAKESPTEHPSAPVIQGVSTQPKFSASSRRSPDGKAIGVVMMEIDGRKKPVLETLGSGGARQTATQRAGVVAKRFAAVQEADKLWWMKLRPGTFKNESVVKTPRAPQGFIVTADAAFAKECGTTPDGLAKLLVRKIRTSFDPRTNPVGRRALSDNPEQKRMEAVDYRQQGDEVFESNPKGAIDLYELSIRSDATYAVAYFRIADVNMSTKNKAGARAALQRAISVLKDPKDLAEAKARLAKLK